MISSADHVPSQLATMWLIDFIGVNIGSTPLAASSARSFSILLLTTSLQILPLYSESNLPRPEPGGSAARSLSRRLSALDLRLATLSLSPSSSATGSSPPPSLYDSAFLYSRVIIFRNAVRVLCSAPSSTGLFTMPATSTNVSARRRAILAPLP